MLSRSEIDRDKLKPNRIDFGFQGRLFVAVVGLANVRLLRGGAGGACTDGDEE